MDLPHRSAAFGLVWRSDIPLAGFDPLPPGSPVRGVPVDVHRVERFADRGDGRPVNRGTVHPDGLRFGWGDEVAFDMTEGTRIAYRPGPDWTGTMPASFYGTVAALTLAWRGLVPLHACAVELDGRAMLVAGAAGAGKSTLTAGLIACGARFVADDLVVVSAGAGGATVARGRPTIRLHPDTAARLDSCRSHPVAGDPRGKWLARPRFRSTADALDLRAILLLEGDAPVAPAPAIGLFAHVFRRHWIDAMPMRGALMRGVLSIAATTPMLTYPVRTESADADWRRHAQAAMEAVRATP